MVTPGCPVHVADLDPCDVHVQLTGVTDEVVIVTITLVEKVPTPTATYVPPDPRQHPGKMMRDSEIAGSDIHASQPIGVDFNRHVALTSGPRRHLLLHHGDQRSPVPPV
jgi:hypothetical protein